MLDAFWQGSRLNGRAVQYAFNSRGIGFTAERSADLLRHCGAGAGVLQAVLFLPLRANGRRERFGRGFITARSGNSCVQCLQHFAIGFVLDACRQGSRLNGRTIEDAFNGRGIRFATEGGADLLCHRSAGASVLQRVLFLPLRADGCGERFGGGFITVRSGNSGAQRL